MMWWALLGAALFAALRPGVFMSLSTFDGGFLAAGAMEILRGGLPMRDFFVIYGPGQYYLVAAAFALFGEDLAVLNLLHLAVMSGLGVLLAAQAARLAPARRGAAAAAVGAMFGAFALCFPPSPGYAAVTAAALLVAAGAQMPALVAQATPHRWLAASLTLAAAGLVRWDFAVLGFVALAVTWLASRPAAPVRGLLRLAGPALAVFLLLFLPFILASGAQRWWQEVPWFHLREFRDWRGLGFIQPNLTLLFEASGRIQKVEALSRWLAFLLPFALALPALALAAARAWRGRGAARADDVLALVLALLALVLLNQQRARTGLEQGFPALVVSLPLAVYLLRALSTGLSRLAALALGLASLLMASAVAQVLPVHLTAEPASLPRYSGWHVGESPPARERARRYPQLVAAVTACVPPDQRLFSGVLDTSRLRVNDPLLYLLTDRRAATRWIEMEPGLTNSPQGQAGLVEELVRAAPPCVVLLDAASFEPNRSSVSNGPSAVDAFIRSRYRLQQRIGRYELWERLR